MHFTNISICLVDKGTNPYNELDKKILFGTVNLDFSEIMYEVNYYNNSNHYVIEWKLKEM